MLTLCFTVRLDSRSSGKTGGNVNLRGQGVGSPPCLSGGGQRMGIWKKRRRRRNRKDRDVNRENYNTLLNILQSKKEPKERSQEKKEGRRKVWTLCHPDYTFILSHVRLHNAKGKCSQPFWV